MQCCCIRYREIQSVEEWESRSVVLFSSRVVPPFCPLVSRRRREGRQEGRLTLPPCLEDPVEALPTDARVAREALDARLLYPPRNHRRRELRQHQRALPEQRRRRLVPLSGRIRRVRDVLEARPGVSYVSSISSSQHLHVLRQIQVHRHARRTWPVGGLGVREDNLAHVRRLGEVEELPLASPVVP